MHKKLETDLMSLAQSILQMKNKENVFLLKQKAHEIYEKLSVLAFVEEYVNATPNLKETKKELTAVVKEAYKRKVPTLDETEAVAEIQKVIEHLATTSPAVEKPLFVKEQAEETEDSLTGSAEIITQSSNEQSIEISTEIEQPFDDLEQLILEDINSLETRKDEKVKAETHKLTLEEELEDIIPVDVMANLFEPLKSISLNDTLQGNIQIGLNDRIAFVKNLFDGSQEDFNRVVSQLNTFKSEKEALNFIRKMVKPDYNWSQQEALEIRFMAIIERKFA
jgi:hypothetical protein